MPSHQDSFQFNSDLVLHYQQRWTELTHFNQWPLQTLFTANDIGPELDINLSKYYLGFRYHADEYLCPNSDGLDTALNYFKKHKNILLLAHTGSGKTRQLKQLGYQILSDKECIAKAYAPVYLSLSDLQAYNTHAEIWQIIESQVRDLYSSPDQTLPPRHHWVLLFDDLEQVTHEAFNFVKDFLRSASQLVAQSVLASNPMSHIKQENFFDSTTVLTFRLEKQKLRKWIEGRCHSSTAEQQVTDFLERKPYPLFNQPVFMSLLCWQANLITQDQVDVKFDQLFENQTEILAFFTRRMIQEWPKIAGQGSSFDELQTMANSKGQRTSSTEFQKQILEALQWLALWHQAHKRKTITADSMSTAFVDRAKINDRLPLNGLESGLIQGLQQGKQAENLLNTLSQATGLLIDAGVGHYQFLDRTFQDYFAAAFLDRLPRAERDYFIQNKSLTLKLSNDNDAIKAEYILNPEPPKNAIIADVLNQSYDLTWVKNYHWPECDIPEFHFRHIPQQAQNVIMAPWMNVWEPWWQGTLSFLVGLDSELFLSLQNQEIDQTQFSLYYETIYPYILDPRLNFVLEAKHHGVDYLLRHLEKEIDWQLANPNYLLDALLNKLQNPGDEDRQEVVNALIAMKNPAIKMPIQRVFHSSETDSETRFYASQILSHLGEDMSDFWQALIDDTQNPEDLCRKTIHVMLLSYFEHQTMRLLNIVQNPDSHPYLLGRAILFALDISDSEPDFREALLKCMTDSNYPFYIRVFIGRFLGHLIPVKVLHQLLTEYLSDQHGSELANELMLAFKNLPSPINRDSLLGYLSDETMDIDIRKAALENISELKDIDDDTMIKLTLKAFLTHPEPKLRLQAAIGFSQHKDPHAIHELMLCLLDEDLRHDASWALRCIEDPFMINLLKPLLKHSDKRVRLEALDLLADYKDPETIDAISECLNDPEHRVIEHAIYALGKIKDNRVIDTILDFLNYPEKDLSRCAFYALTRSQLDGGTLFSKTISQCKLKLPPYQLKRLWRMIPTHAQAVLRAPIGDMGLNPQA